MQQNAAVRSYGYPALLTQPRELDGGGEPDHLVVSCEDQAYKPLATLVGSDIPAFSDRQLLDHLNLVATPAPVPFGRARPGRQQDHQGVKPVPGVDTAAKADAPDGPEVAIHVLASIVLSNA